MGCLWSYRYRFYSASIENGMECIIQCTGIHGRHRHAGDADWICGSRNSLRPLWAAKDVNMDHDLPGDDVYPVCCCWKLCRPAHPSILHRNGIRGYPTNGRDTCIRILTHTPARYSISAPERFLGSGWYIGRLSRLFPGAAYRMAPCNAFWGIGNHFRVAYSVASS